MVAMATGGGVRWCRAGPAAHWPLDGDRIGLKL